MRKKLSDTFSRWLPSFLLAAGLLLTLLGALDLLSFTGAALLIAFVMTALLQAVSLNRKTILFGSPILFIAVMFFLFSGGDFSLMTDVFRALMLQISGVPAALPLVAWPAVRLFSLLTASIAFFFTRRRVSCLPSVMICVLAAMMIWLTGRSDLFPFLVPAVAAAMTMLLLDRHEEASPLRILPWTVALVALSFLMTPSDGVVFPPLKDAADDLRQAILDRFFFTEPRDVFSLSAEGFYPQGSGQLGGPVSPSDHPVLQVSAPRTAYLRGVVLNAYDGRSWRNTLGGRRYLWNSSSSAPRRQQIFDQTLPDQALNASLTEPYEISVRMLSEGASTLFVPQRIRELRGGGEIVPYFSDATEIFITRNLQPGDTWTITAPLFQAGDPGLGLLTDAAEMTEDPRWDAVRETYTALPAHLEEPVWQMAEDVTSPAQSAYEKALALQRFLSRSYRYTLTPPSQPGNIDFVTHFLFNTGEGYCTYFASAMTVLCRMAGLPARYVEGYLAEPDAGGEALVTGLNAHAWTEVYFKGFGWVTFDATPRRAGNQEDPSGGSGGSSGPESTPETSPEPTAAPTEEPTPEAESSPENTESAGNTDAQETPTPESPDSASDPTQPPESEEDPENESPPGENVPDRSPFPLWGLLLPLLLLMLVAGLLFRWVRTSPAHQEKRTEDENERFDLWLRDSSELLYARGLTRSAGQTPMSWTRLLDAEAELPVRLAPLGECISLLRYSALEALPSDTALARETALGLRRSLPFTALIRYAFRRVFLPSRKKEVL